MQGMGEGKQEWMVFGGSKSESSNNAPAPSRGRPIMEESSADPEALTKAVAAEVSKGSEVANQHDLAPPLALAVNRVATRYSVDDLNAIFVRACDDDELPHIPGLDRGADPKKNLTWLLVGSDPRTCNYDKNQNFDFNVDKSVKLSTEQVAQA
jgi:hypothetical protein